MLSSNSQTPVTYRRIIYNYELFVISRIAKKRQTVRIVFAQEAKNRHFRPAGATHCTDSCAEFGQVSHESVQWVAPAVF